MNHGRTWTYDRYGCRCGECRAAKAEARRRHRRGGHYDVDDIAVERACRGDRTVRLNREEMAAAFAWLNSHGYSLREIARRLGVTERTVARWRSGRTRNPYGRPAGTARRDVA